jgi:hypothetical protein
MTRCACVRVEKCDQVCVCVCEREREERGSQRREEGGGKSSHAGDPSRIISASVRRVVCLRVRVHARRTSSLGSGWRTGPLARSDPARTAAAADALYAISTPPSPCTSSCAAVAAAVAATSVGESQS